MSEFCDSNFLEKNIKVLSSKLNFGKYLYLSLIHLESQVKQMENEVSF